MEEENDTLGFSGDWGVPAQDFRGSCPYPMGGRGPAKPQLNFFMQLGHKFNGRGVSAEVPNSQFQKKLNFLNLNLLKTLLKALSQALGSSRTLCRALRGKESTK